MKTGKMRKGKRKMWVMIGILGVLAVVMGGGFLFTAPGRQELMKIKMPRSR